MAGGRRGGRRGGGRWEALAAVERTRLAAAAARVLEPLARAGREGRVPTAPSAGGCAPSRPPRCWPPAGSPAAPRSACSAALAGPVAVLAVDRARRRRWREELRRAAPACARAMADALGAGRSIRTAIADAAGRPEGAAAHELRRRRRARCALGEPTEAVLVRAARPRRGRTRGTRSSPRCCSSATRAATSPACCASWPPPARPPTGPSATRAGHRAGPLHGLARARAAARGRGAGRAGGAGLRGLAARRTRSRPGSRRWRRCCRLAALACIGRLARGRP